MDRGVLLLRGGPGRRDRVVAWVRRGPFPAYVLPGERWWGVVAAGSSELPAPYDDGVRMLAGHPVTWRLRPSLGLFVAGDVALVGVNPRGLRQVTRWVGWTPGAGRHAVPGLPLASADDIAAAAGVPGAGGALAQLFADPGGTALDLLDDLATTLGLPFVQVCHGVDAASLPGSQLVAPASASVVRFAKIVSEEIRLERELEEGL